MEAVYVERERDMSDFDVVSNGRGQDVSSTADARHMDQPDATFACDRGLLNPTPTLPMRPERRSGPAYDPSTRQSPVHLQYTTTLDGAVGPPARPGITTRREEVSDPRRLPAPDERYVKGGGASLLQLSPNSGQVFHGERRLQADVERMSDRQRDGLMFDDVRRSMSLDRGYLTGSRLSPPTVEKPGESKEQQPVSEHYNVQHEQLAHTSLMTTRDYNVGFEPVTNDDYRRSMYPVMQQHQQSATPTHSRTQLMNTVDDYVQQQTAMNVYNNTRVTCQHSNRASPMSDVVDVNYANTHSLLEQSEVQFNPAALERARQAGWRSEQRDIHQLRALEHRDVHFS